MQREEPVSLSQEDLKELSIRCRLSCGVEAINNGLPSEIGYYMHDSLIEGYREEWTTTEYYLWSEFTLSLFEEFPEEAIVDLCHECDAVMGRYGSYIRSYQDYTLKEDG